MGAKLIYTCDFKGCEYTSNPPDNMKIIHIDGLDYYLCNGHYEVVLNLFERK